MEDNQLEKSKVYVSVEVTEYIPDFIVSKSIESKAPGRTNIISFNSKKGLIAKISPFDTFAQMIEGHAEIIIEGVSFLLGTGQSIILPAYKANHIKGDKRFKMISTVIKVVKNKKC